jgi:hypothetical protein
MDYFSEHHIVGELREACKIAGSQLAWSKAKAVSNAAVCNILNGKREVNEPVANALGYVKKTVYVKMNGDSHHE